MPLKPIRPLTPEQAEQARKNYLLTRFWISARGFWGRHGDRLAWPFNRSAPVLLYLVGFQYGMNVWNRAIFDALEKREAAHRYLSVAVFFPLAVGSVAVAGSGLCPHDASSAAGAPG